MNLGRCLKQAVDKRREGGAFGYDQKQADREEQDDDGGEPPFLAHAEEAPEFSENGKFAAHLELFFVIARPRSSALPISGFVALETIFKRALSAKALHEADRRDHQKKDHG